MRKLLVLFFVGLFFALFPLNSFAQTPAPVTSTTTEETNINAFTTDPPQTPNPDRPDYFIDDFTNAVTISFPGLASTYSSSDLYVCLRNDLCLQDPYLKQIDNPGKLYGMASKGLPSDKFYKSFNNSSKGLLKEGSMVVCGNGDEDLKPGPCNPNKDYFFGGSVYIATIYLKQDDQFVAVARGGFYVSHGMPKIELSPLEGLKPGTKFTLTISQDKFRPGGKNRNNYEVVLEGPGLKDSKKDACDWVQPEKPVRQFKFPKPKESGNDHYTDPDDSDLLNSGYIVPGRYTFHISEQDEEGHDDCSGGFRLASITCTIGPDSTSNPNKCQKIVYDPRKEDAKELLNLLDLINGVNKGVPLPCNKTNPFVKNPLDCKEIDTAIGTIQLTPIGFITRLFSIVLAIGGFGALILIIYSGYRIMISRGNPDSLKGARETLTAAIIGLLFIVFSYVILSIIAGNILKIPGFS